MTMVMIITVLAIIVPFVDVIVTIIINTITVVNMDVSVTIMNEYYHCGQEDSHGFLSPAPFAARQGDACYIPLPVPPLASMLEASTSGH